MKALEKYAILYNVLHPFHASIKERALDKRADVQPC
jgi:hypothetical protein